MGYFELTAPVRIKRYPFDYHSHFSGILAVHGGDGRPSLAGLLADADHAGDAAKGELALFGLALDFMSDPASNPFARLLGRSVADRVQYERAECAAENVYVAAVLLGARGYLPMDVLAAPAYAPELFAAVRAEVVGKALRAPDAADPDLLATVRYFNGKIYSANKYTPFDDAYKLRGSFVKLFCGGDPARYRDWEDAQRDRYHAWIDATFRSLAEEGITRIQAAATEDEMDVLAQRAAAFNRENGTAYKLLVHTPHQYMPDEALRKYLDAKVLPLLTGEGYADVVGLDLLGAENKVGNYRELMAFLHDRRGELQRRFGPGEGRRSARMAVHVHCGEGSGFGADNRSMIGYLLHEAGYPGEAFFVDLANYVLSGAKAAEARRGDTPRGTRGTKVPYGLFDELFRNNSLTWRGRLLRRYDISSARSREAAAFNAKRNVMALSETFDDRPEGADGDWYRLLAAGDGTPYAFRLGHAYHYRNYVAARYPQLAFDTNLGSNAITGASGLFGSIESYRINRGFRHLDGYIDTDVLEAAGNAVAYMASEALTPAQVALFVRLSALEQPMAEVLEDARAEIEAQLEAALGPVYRQRAYYERYCALVLELSRDADGSAALRYQVLARVLTVFANWRSYLLGADGQGTEHTDIRLEFLRMCLLLAYGLLPTGHRRVGVDLLDALQGLLLEIGGAYWAITVGPPPDAAALPSEVLLEAFDGFKAPGSVATVRRATVHG
ncbi:hypothetical protein [Luteimonas sp. R10]|uniref:hypothetical protein n=1 Tax=Luteimonas sp. R10 TaxID=3108176 RepID=UPI0030914318|nr:hypothetical protein U3649_05425 [Luteimonas sp. R10]